MTHRVDSSPSPPVHPTLALRYTALEITLAALSGLSGFSDADAGYLCTCAEALPLPDHLARRFEDALTSGLSVEEVSFNPYLQHDQIVLLTLGLVRYTQLEDFVAQWVKPYRLTPADLTYLTSNAPRPTPPVPTAEALLNPPTELLPLADHLALRLHLGSTKSQLLGGISPYLYEHPWDRAALQKMRQITGFEVILNKFSEWHFEKLTQLQSYSSRIQIGPQQFPEIWAIWREALDRAGLSGDHEPELYVKMGSLNAFTTGVTVKQVVVSSALVSLLEPPELLFVLGHELGHIRSEHVLYSMLANWLPQFFSAVGQATLGLGSLLGKGLELAVYDWHRKSEFTCDRFGLLICQSMDAAQRTLMKLAGAPPRFFSKMNWRAFQAQAGKYTNEANLHSNVYKFLLVSQQSHPWPAVRAAQLQEWYDGGSYAKLLDLACGNSLQAIPTRSSNNRTCSHCDGDLAEGDAFCAKCGSKVSLTRR